jgi:SAM-dependent methyltransferase
MSADYYDDNAQSFYDSTVDVDMVGFYCKFLPLVGAEGRILDLGCGSGRDTKYFVDLGYKVDAIDASKEMVRLASIKSGLEVKHMSFELFSPDLQYDGIWACASLLHVEPKALKSMFVHISHWLNVSGVLYASFKYGDGVRVKDGRTFTDMDEHQLKVLLSAADLILKESWVTYDQRPERNEKWLNALIIKHQ